MITNTTVAHREHDHGRCLSAALIQAQTLCKAHGARLTTTREAVLRLVWQSHKPVGAYHIIEQLSAEQGKQIMPPTVYRALDFLLTQGLIHRIASLNAFVGCPLSRCRSQRSLYAVQSLRQCRGMQRGQY